MGHQHPVPRCRNPGAAVSAAAATEGRRGQRREEAPGRRADGWGRTRSRCLPRRTGRGTTRRAACCGSRPPSTTRRGSNRTVRRRANQMPPRPGTRWPRGSANCIGGRRSRGPPTRAICRRWPRSRTPPPWAHWLPECANHRSIAIGGCVRFSPYAPQDAELLTSISRGEFTINGFPTAICGRFCLTTQPTYPMRNVVTRL